MKTRITILSTTRQDFPLKPGQKEASFKISCQCVVHTDPPVVGVLNVFKQANLLPEPGEFLAEFGLRVAWDTKEIGGQLVGLEPIPGGSKPGTTAVQERSKADISKAAS